MRKESGVCGQSPRQARAPSPVAEISAACSLGAHTIWRPGEEEEDGKGQKQIVDFANKTSCPSCGPGGILEVQHFLPWNRMSELSCPKPQSFSDMGLVLEGGWCWKEGG